MYLRKNVNASGQSLQVGVDAVFRAGKEVDYPSRGVYQGPQFREAEDIYA